MGTAKRPQPVKLFASIILRPEADLRTITDLLTPFMGGIEELTPLKPFEHTRYYEKEMGQGLLRTFALFEPLMEREALPHIKIETNKIEELFGAERKRTVNIDPGYLALEHVILATTKGYAHRVYLNNGIHADLTLRYVGGAYQSLDWTYPDYGENTTISLFLRWREELKKVLKCQKV